LIPEEAIKTMSISPSELVIILVIVIIYVAVPAILIVTTLLFYRRLKEIEQRLRSIEEKINGG
jgi:nitrate reductase gamma subunit